jgi:hypothetical protein
MSIGQDTWIDISGGNPNRPVHHGESTWRYGEEIPMWACFMLLDNPFGYYRIGDPINADPAKVTCPGCLELLARRTEKELLRQGPPCT